MDLQTGHLEDRYHARIILLLLFIMKVFCIFWQINFSKKLEFFLRSGVRKSGGIHSKLFSYKWRSARFS